MGKGEILKRETSWLLKEKYPRVYKRLLVKNKNSDLPAEAESDIRRLKRGEPVDYLIGFCRFLGCKIGLSLKPLIPRPETEYWVEKTIKDIKTASKSRRIACLDIFAGSGCVGLAILKGIKAAKVDFSEKEKKFLKQIKLNAELNHINPKRYRLFESDVFEKISRKYDYIFANPPYVALARKKKIQKSVLNFEPRKAVFGGKDGLLYIRRFLKRAKKHLKTGGKIYLEFDSVQKKELAKILKRFRYPKYRFFKDQYGKWRYLELD